MADVTLTSSYDGKGNVVLYGASATFDGAGAVTMSLDTGDRPNAVAMTSINLSFVAEVESYFRYYMLRASTLSAPDKPTTYPPSASWTDTEPTYTAGASSSLYFVDLAVFTDGSWLYSDVSLSTSYEAAKEAYNKAQNAQDSVDNLDIGGRNLLRCTGSLPISEKEDAADAISLYKSSIGTLESTDDSIILRFAGSGNVAISVPIAYDGCINNYDELILSFDYRGNITNPGAFYFMQRTTPNVSNNLNALKTLVANETEWQHYSVKFANANANVRTVYRVLMFYGNAAYTADNWIEIRASSLKLEKGNMETDWTPAPEDTDAELQRVISEEHASIISEASTITMNALKSYATIDDFETYKESNESQLQLMTDRFSVELSQTTKHISDTNESLQSQINTVTSYMHYTVEDGLILGKTDDPAKMQLQNDELSILMNGVPVQSFDAEGHAITPELQVTRSFKLLGYMFEVDQNGNVNCEYVG